METTYLKKIIFKKVGNGGVYENGSQTFFVSSDFVAMVDCNVTKDYKGDNVSPINAIKRWARKEGDKYVIDLAIFSHGDADHIGGFEDIYNAINAETLEIKCLCHQGFDRVKLEGIDLNEYPDYKAFTKEIAQRSYNRQKTFILRTEMTERSIGIFNPNFNFEVLNPSKEMDKEPTDVNDMSLVILFEFYKKKVLLCGDTCCKSWLRMLEDEEVRSTLQDSKIDLFELPHHGSATFFADERDTVINAKSESELPNYKALDIIDPKRIILSAETYFPGKDFSGDNPPHYATFKWLRHWLYSKGRCSKDAIYLNDISATNEEDVEIEINETQHTITTVPSNIRPYQEI